MRSRSNLSKLFRLGVVCLLFCILCLLYTYFFDETVLNNVPVAVIEELAKLDTSTRNILEAAERIKNRNKTVLLTLINYAYIPLAYSWLCNTKLLGIHNQVLFITSDKLSHQQLKRDWPEVNSVFMDNVDENGDQDYMHAGYARLVIRRTEIIMKMLELNIAVFLFETDCTWLNNPLPKLSSYNEYDVLVNPVSYNPGLFNGGLIYIFPSEGMKRLWAVLTVNLLKEYEKIKSLPKGSFVEGSDWDQSYFSKMIIQKFGGISYKILPLSHYPDGKWYGYSEKRRKILKPSIICNNWIIGNTAKIDRAKKWGHWFVKRDFSCDMKKVEAIFKNT